MKSDFCVAVHLLVFLNHKGRSLSSEELAENICTNAARVRKVAAKLKTAGLIETKEGVEGGYRFVGDAAKVTLEQVRAALGLRVVETNWLSGDMDQPCLVSSGMAGIMQEILDHLDDCCRRELEQKTIADIDRQIFKNLHA